MEVYLRLMFLKFRYRLGYETRLVSKAEMHSELASDRYHGAMVDPKGAGLHVGKFTRGLAEAAARMGERREQLRALADQLGVLLGGTGGVGSYATQFAAERGIEVIAVTRPEYTVYAKSMGAALRMLDADPLTAVVGGA